MEMWKIIILGVVGLFVAAVLIEVWLRRGQPKPTLADTLGKATYVRPDDRPPLGMEEIDMDIVHEAERLNAHLDTRNKIYTRRK